MQTEGRREGGRKTVKEGKKEREGGKVRQRSKATALREREGRAAGGVSVPKRPCGAPCAASTGLRPWKSTC